MIDPEQLRAVAVKLHEEFKTSCRVEFEVRAGDKYSGGEDLFTVWIGQIGALSGSVFATDKSLDVAVETACKKWHEKDDDLKNAAKERGFKLVPL